MEEELEHVLSSMNEGKILGSDRLTIKFNVGFHDLIKDGLLKVVKESCKVLSQLNSTFIMLIPKKKKVDSLNDYRSISFCNVIYKLITKIIAYRLRPILSELISKEQVGFLQKRQIHDAMALAEEVLRSKDNLPSFALMLDFSKAYDRESCTFIKLALVHRGVDLQSIN